MAKPIANKHARGFTLVEVLVALAIVAVALPALMAQMLQLVNGGEYIRDKNFAYWVAQNQIESLRVEQRLSGEVLKGTATGESTMAGRDWYWEITSSQAENQKDYGIWQQTVSVGLSKDDIMATVVGYMREAQQSSQGGGNVQP
ncbi:type II secretion system minor pseudopilin GspI [Aurantivibrio plasticivorans]